MITFISLLPLMMSLPLTLGSPSPKSEHHGTTHNQARTVLPAAFILAGDSTTAIQVPVNGGGWGNGFLSFLQNGAWGINKGHNGATTVSYVADGDWANVTAFVVQKKSEGFDPYVTISFGHNDQKPAANISLAQYQSNMQNLALDVVSHGGTPIIVTSLTRRAFTSEHNATDSLHDQRIAAIAAANTVNATYLDLNYYSLQYVDAIGEEATIPYDLNGNDTTHLSPWGSVVFGRMLADLLLIKKPELGTWFAPNETLSNEIWGGLPA